MKLNQTQLAEETSYLELHIPAGTLIPLTEADLKGMTVFPKVGERGDTNVAILISLILLGKVSPYPHNRGRGTVASTTAKSVRNELDFDTIGEVTVGLYSDEIFYGNDKKTMHLSSFHSRMMGIIQRHLDGKITKEEYLQPISIRYCRDFMKTYKRFGEPGSAHSTKNKIQTVDLAFGGLIRDIELLIGEEICNFIKDKHSTVLSAILVAMESEKKGTKIPWYSWGTIYRLRGGASKRANDFRGSVSVSKDQIAKIADGIKEWYKMVKLLKETAGKTNVSKIVKSSGIFGFFIVDHYASTGYFYKTHDRTVNNMLSHITETFVFAKTLCRGGKEEITENCDQFKKILKKKSRSSTIEA